MTEFVEVLQSDLTFVVTTADGPAQIAGNIDELEPIMRDPLPIAVDDEGHLMFASVSDQLVLEFQAPKVILRDSGRSWPISPRFASGVPGLHEFMDRFSLQVPAYGWNVEGDLSGTSGETMLSLLNAQRLSAMSGSELAPKWNPSKIELVSQEILDGSGVLTFSMEAISGVDESAHVRFSMNAHFDRTSGLGATQPVIHSDEILGKGWAFFDMAHDLLERFVGLEGNTPHGHHG